MPLGAPVFLALDRPEAYGFWVAQDTGGAIKGANRFDTFWGHGAEATHIAGLGRQGAWDRFAVGEASVHFQYTEPGERIRLVTIMIRGEAP